MTDRIQAVEIRLWAACFVLVLACALLQSVWVLQLAGACAFAGLAFWPSSSLRLSSS